MPVLGPSANANYPVLETILNLVRSLSNDAFAGNTNTAGEGQVLTDLYQATANFNPQVVNCFNSAIREMYRHMRNIKAKGLIRDNFILIGIPPVNGPLGVSFPDPTVQTYLSTGFFFDGTNMNTSFTLPADIMMPLKMWERQSGTTNPLVEMYEAQNGLDPANQSDELRDWEWREGRINFRGALIARDIRLKYFGFVQTFTPSNPVPANYFTSTQIPVIDCEEVVAFITLRNLAIGLNPAMITILDGKAEEALFDLKNQEVRRMQATDYRRREWDDFATGDALDEYSI